MSPEVAKACRASPLVLPWQLENCCETVEGEQVPCMRVPLEDLRVSTREGRRHWVFEPSIPPVSDRSISVELVRHASYCASSILLSAFG